MTPIFEGFADSKHFSIVDVLIVFSFCHNLRTVGNQVPEVIRMLLGDHTIGGIVECVNFNVSRERQVPDGENGLRGESRLQSVEGLFLFRPPQERSILFSKIV